MKLWISIILCLIMIGIVEAFAPLTDHHDTKNDVDSEFRNIFLNAQPRQIRIMTSSPTLIDLQEGEIIISTPCQCPVYRFNNTIFYIKSSTK